MTPSPQASAPVRSVGPTSWIYWLVLVLTALVVGPTVWVVAFLALAPLAGLVVLADPLDAVVVLVVAYGVGLVPALVMALIYGWIGLLVRNGVIRLLLALVIGGAGTGLMTLFAVAVARELAGEGWLVLFPVAGAISALVCAVIADHVFPRLLSRHG